jgi:TPR repeat protein
MKSLDELNEIQNRAYSLLKAKDYAGSRVLFEEIYELSPKSVAAHLGFIHSREDSSEYNLEKAVQYLNVAASENNAHSLSLLASLLLKDGRKDEALERLKKGSELGEGTCSYLAHTIYAARKDKKNSEMYLQRAVDQASPPAIQKRSIQQIKGDFGVAQIVPGIVSYFTNIPRLVRFAKENA